MVRSVSRSLHLGLLFFFSFHPLYVLYVLDLHIGYGYGIQMCFIGNLYNNHILWRERRVCLCVAFSQALSFCSLPGLMLDALQGQSRPATAQIPFPSFSYRLTVTGLRRAGSSYEIKRKYLCSRFFYIESHRATARHRKLRDQANSILTVRLFTPGNDGPVFTTGLWFRRLHTFRSWTCPPNVSSYLCAAVPEQTRSSAFIKVKAADTCAHTRAHAHKQTLSHAIIPLHPGFLPGKKPASVAWCFVKALTPTPPSSACW